MMRQVARSPVEVMLGSSKMKRAVVASAACMLALSGGRAALGAEPTRIVDVRVGRHESFDRLVVELERRVDLRRVPGAASDPFVLELDARPLLPHQRLETPFARMGVVVIEAVPGGGRIRVEARPRRVRVFRLREPDRVVLDFADPGPEPFDAPPGTSCPFVETVSDADYVLLVTEPTPFGLHDLQLAATVLQKINVIVNIIAARMPMS